MKDIHPCICGVVVDGENWKMHEKCSREFFGAPRQSARDIMQRSAEIAALEEVEAGPQLSWSWRIAMFVIGLGIGSVIVEVFKWLGW